MSMHKDFDAMLREKAGDKPTFSIAGQTFTLRARLPYKQWDKLIALMQSEEGNGMDATHKFFNSVLVRADRERFAALLDSEDDDDEQVIGVAEMGDLIDYVMEHFTGKLQSSSNGSSPGSTGTGQSRNVVSLNARTTAV